MFLLHTLHYQCLSPVINLYDDGDEGDDRDDNDRYFLVVTMAIMKTMIMTVNQEYERAVIFRLGRLLTGGARGPGVFFIIPCVDVFEKIDMRTMTYEIPPQEVDIFNLNDHIILTLFYNLFGRF